MIDKSKTKNSSIQTRTNAEIIIINREISI